MAQDRTDSNQGTQSNEPVEVTAKSWSWGFTQSAETWNGRLAMLGFVAAVITELLAGQGLLSFYTNLL
ncbi:MAG: chlorophyll a/b-binding protein [Cyanobacteria bacterium J06627_28]